MSDEIKIECSVGEEINGDLPADVEVVEGQNPTSKIEGEEVEGREAWNYQRPKYRIVICPFSGCHSANRIGAFVHWVHCWNCHRNFHVQ